MTEYRLKRAGDVDLVFDGTLLAEQSSWEKGKTHWGEVRIWRTDTGKYVTQRLGRSSIPDEGDKITTRILRSAGDVAGALRSRQGDSTFMSNLALDALDEAAEKDPAIGSQNVERI